MMDHSRRPDGDLLKTARAMPEGFGEFYRRHERPIHAFLQRRTGDADLTADLAAETFAVALLHARRFDPKRGPAIGWLLGIARNLLARHHERRGIEDRARRRLGVATEPLDTATRDAIERLESGEAATRALAELPADQAAAVRGRVVHERAYDEMAAESGVPAPTLRKRVSRGLSSLRTQLEDDR